MTPLAPPADVPAVNALAVASDESLAVGVFQHARASLGDRLGAQRIGATVYDASAGHPIWPYHYHYGVEEWLHVLSGTPVLRDGAGERALRAGDLASFPAGRDGAHTLTGPGRFMLISTGQHIEPWLTVYPDSGKMSTPEGIVLLEPTVGYWHGEPGVPEAPADPEPIPTAAPVPLPRPVLNLNAVDPDDLGAGIRCSQLGATLGAVRLGAELMELDAGAAVEPSHFARGHEALFTVLGGTLSLRGGRDLLVPGDVARLPEAPELINRGDGVARVLVLSTR